MSGYNTILKCERIRERATKLGFMLTYPRWGDNRNDMVGIKPLDKDALPIYARDAEIYCSTLEELESFFDGIEWARDYDRMLRVSDEKKRGRKEQDERNRQLMQILATGESKGVQT